MTLRQKCEELIKDWLGADAAEQSAKRTQLVTDLVSLLEEGKKEREPSHDPTKSARHERAA